MLMTYANVKECKAAGLDPSRVDALAQKLSLLAMEAKRLGLTIFGSGEGRLQQRGVEAPLIVARLDGPFDGGAGDPHRNSPDGLQRAE